MELCSLVWMHVPQWALLGSYLLDKHIIQVHPFLSPIHAPIYTFTLSVARVLYGVTPMTRSKSSVWEVEPFKSTIREAICKKKNEISKCRGLVCYVTCNKNGAWIYACDGVEKKKKTLYRMRLSGIYCTAVPFFKDYTIRHIIKSIVMFLKSGLIKLFYSITDCYCLF